MSKEQDEISKLLDSFDEEDELAEQFGIASIPTVLVFKEGKVVNKSLGLVAKSKLLDLVKG